jgi:hypothetical protein
MKNEGWKEWFPVVSDSGYEPPPEAATLDVPKSLARLVRANELTLSVRKALRSRIKVTFEGKRK